MIPRKVKADLIEVTDDLLDYLLKEDPYVKIADSLRMLLGEQWFKYQEDALVETIEFLDNGKGILNDKDVKELLVMLENKMQIDLNMHISNIVNSKQLEAYQRAYRDNKVKFSYTNTNKETLEWMHDFETYWIGKFNKEQITEVLGKRLNELVLEVNAQGMGRTDAGNYFKNELKTFFSTPEKFTGTTQQYYEGLATNIITRARAFANVDSYVDSGIEYYKVVAVNDSRTSKICRHMHGRIIPVQMAVEYKDKLTSIKDPEEVKSKFGWLKTKDTEKLKNMKDKDLPLGLALPPYHFNCRTTTVLANSYEINEFEATLEKWYSPLVKKFLPS